MVRMWCYHRRLIEVHNVSLYIAKLRHADDKTSCTGRNPKF